jgi:hypothetical protein
LIPDVKYKQITGSGLDIINSDGKEESILADAIVLAAGSKLIMNFRIK